MEVSATFSFGKVCCWKSKEPLYTPQKDKTTVRHKHISFKIRLRHGLTRSFSQLRDTLTIAAHININKFDGMINLHNECWNIKHFACHTKRLNAEQSNDRTNNKFLLRAWQLFLLRKVLSDFDCEKIWTSKAESTETYEKNYNCWHLWNVTALQVLVSLAPSRFSFCHSRINCMETHVNESVCSISLTL